jgi:hypothetical protein
MELIIRLREERAALVARLAQIDKMLRQYEEWGREAQRLLSLTNPVKAESVDRAAAHSVQKPLASPDVSDQPKIRHVGHDGEQVPSQSTLPVTGRKTPIHEFEATVIDVLRESGQPMDRVALYEALTARGIVIGSGNRDKDLNALSARVYRMAQEPKNHISGERGQGYRLLMEEESDDTGVAQVLTNGDEASTVFE